MNKNSFAHRLTYKLYKKIMVPLTLKFFLKKINNLENIKNNQTFIVASNHTSFLDPLIIDSIFSSYLDKKINYIGKKVLFRTLPSKIFHESVGTIPLGSKDKGKLALKTAERYLKEGKIIGIFPEGKRSKDGKLSEGKTGVARLSLAARAPVLPIAINGTFELMPTGKIIPKFKKNVTVNVGKFMHFDRYYGKAISKKILRNVTNEIMMNIKRLMIIS